ncbi:MAG: hypothetical protein WCA30_10800 [Dermatophilaceae bacterium]
MGITSSPARDITTDSASRPVPRLAGWALTALLAFWGIGAIGGGAYLASARDGSNIGFELDLLEGTPFPDFLIPGIILLSLGVAAVALAAVLGLAVHRRSAPSWMRTVLILTALGINAWIFGEMAFLWSTVAAMPEADRDFFYVFWAVYVALSLAIGTLTWWVTRRRTR